MKKICFLILSLFLVGALLNGQENKTALVIGNSNYVDGKLKNPVNDAKLMNDTLTSLGFSVTVFYDVKSQGEMKKIVRDFGSKIAEKKGTALFYYAGHGLQVKGINYLVPINASITNEEYVEYECLDSNEVFTAMNIAKSKTNIVILDACRNNPFEKSFRSGGDRGLAPISKSPNGTIIAFATAPGSVASDGSGGSNGLYTEELVKVMKQPGLKLYEVFMEVRKSVAKRSGNAQIPWENSSLFEDFFFVEGKNEDKKKIKIEEEIVYGNAKIEVKEKGAIYLDGEFIGNISPEKKISLKDLTVGEHSIEIVYENNKEKQNLYIEEKKETLVSFSYKKKEKENIPDNFIYVEGGSFKSTKSNYYGKNVTVSDFYIGKYEVTQKEWVEVMGSNPSNFKGENLPVENVSWYDCIEYCNKRSIKEGLNPVYTIDKNNKDSNNTNSNDDDIKWTVKANWAANGYRLPTEAEWEYAATGGQKSASYTYSGSENIDEIAWYTKTTNDKGTKEVGTKKPNELGIYDMSGNVWEWCWDWYGEDIQSGQSDPKGVTGGSYRLLRGGIYYYSSDICQVGSRNYYSPDYYYYHYGVRLVRTN